MAFERMRAGKHMVQGWGWDLAGVPKKAEEHYQLVITFSPPLMRLER